MVEVTISEEKKNFLKRYFFICTMKALVFDAPGKPVQLKIVDKPTPHQGECLVEMKAASLNHRDIWMIQGLYPVAQGGVVQGSCGAGLMDGREVLINPNIQWGTDPTYPDHNQYQILGMPTNGTFSEFLLTKNDRLVDKPDHLTWEEAGALPLAGLTAYSALFTKGSLKKGQRVLISGVGGGVALFALQFSVAFGAQVYVTSGSEEKIQKAMKLGAIGGANYNGADWDKEFIEEFGKIDLVIDSAGGEGFDKLLSVCRPQASIVMYGGTKGKTTFLPRKLFWKELQIIGSTMGSDQEFIQMVDFVKKHQVRPVVDSVFTLEEADEAYRKLQEGNQFGKVVFKM